MAEASPTATPEAERAGVVVVPPTSVSPPKKIPPIPWSHMETVRLIESYQEKWYSLKRGQLKASQWEEVAVLVAARCGYDEPSKTSTQCRHKMEKLRKRYRSEKQRSTFSAWPYFDLMDLMERGPFPISARPIALPLIGSSHSHSHPRIISHSIDDDDADENESSKSRSINHILRRRAAVSPVLVQKKLSPGLWNSSEGGSSRFLKNCSVVGKRRRPCEMDDDDEEEEEEVEEEEGGEVLAELASVIRAFGEGFVRTEHMKMEMLRETERYRMEMEAKRTEMILESQSHIVDMIAKALGSQRKVKKTQET